MTSSGYVPVDGVDLYWESRGTGGTPLLVVHGGFGLISGLAPLLDAWAVDRQVVAIELQGHGHTRDVDRPFSHAGFGEQVAGAVRELGLGPADLLGYSLGAEACLHAAARHPDAVRRLVLAATGFRRDANHPEVLAGMEHVSSALLPQFQQSPMYAGWREVAPDPSDAAFAALMDKTGALLREPYDWTEQVRALTMPTLLVFGDTDMVPTSHVAEFFALLDGGVRDGGIDGSQLGRNRLAVLPGRTHYDLLESPLLVPVVQGFLG